MKSLSYLIMLVVLTLSLATTDVAAQTVSDLYRASLPVANQSTRQRDKVISVLFAKVLVKVSGSSKVLQNVTIKKQLSRAIEYTVEFNFSRLNNVLQLNARFNEKLVDQLLKSARVSIWGTRRPSVMLWVAVEDHQSMRQIVSESTTSDLSVLLLNQARNRGLPMLLPMWDLEDQLQVGLTDIWGLFSDKVAAANIRYQSDFMIIAKVSPLGVSSRINWVIYKSPTNVDAFDIQPAQIIGSGTDELATTELALNALIDQSSDFFSRQFSVDTQARDSTLVFNVADIRSIETFVEVTNYLRSLKAVEQLQVSVIKDQQFTFSLKILGDSQSLLDVIDLERKLVSQSYRSSSQPILFQWHTNNGVNNQ